MTDSIQQRKSRAIISTNNSSTSSKSVCPSSTSSSNTTSAASNSNINAQSYASKATPTMAIASSTTTSTNQAGATTTTPCTNTAPPTAASPHSFNSNKDKPNKNKTDYIIVLRGIKSTSASEESNNRTVEKKLVEEYRLITKEEWKQTTKRWFGLSTTIAIGGRKKEYNHYSSVISLALPSSEIAARILRQKRSNEVVHLLQEDNVYITRLMTKEELQNTKSLWKRRRNNIEEMEHRWRKEREELKYQQQQRELPGVPSVPYPNVNYQATHKYYQTRNYNDERSRQLNINDARRY
ncbi:MAG: hypothetical protein JWL77_7001 [Chthonomonadaceae bacterium]|nr:hypothetical protein [Chthonomonadaceae bacterium]